uniref:Uncharacterized protein n=1 Tax=Cyanistes caeruleus TaxID=156563 RepID=A0A8C0VGY7_CYACU
QHSIPKPCTGIAGTPGTPGAPGIAGTGNIGNSGNTGNTGNSGDTGNIGNTGIIGNSGNIGMLPGTPGIAGKPGIAGISGIPGTPGIPGCPREYRAQGIPGCSREYRAQGIPGCPRECRAQGIPGCPRECRAQGMSGGHREYRDAPGNVGHREYRDAPGNAAPEPWHRGWSSQSPSRPWSSRCPQRWDPSGCGTHGEQGTSPIPGTFSACREKEHYSQYPDFPSCRKGWALCFHTDRRTNSGCGCPDRQKRSHSEGWAARTPHLSPGARGEPGSAVPSMALDGAGNPKFCSEQQREPGTHRYQTHRMFCPGSHRYQAQNVLSCLSQVPNTECSHIWRVSPSPAALLLLNPEPGPAWTSTRLCPLINAPSLMPPH